MVNDTGANGTNIGICPSDAELRAAFEKYTEERLKWQEMQSRLTAEFNYTPKRALIFKKMKELGIHNTARRHAKSWSKSVMKTFVMTELDNDLNKRNGPATIQEIMAKKHNVANYSDFIRGVMKDEYPEGAILRAPSNRFGKIPRGHHLVIGPWQELHGDGHEKLSSKALSMGPVGIDIYGFRQQVGFIQKLVVVPNSRLANAIGHIHLDVIEEAGFRMPVQITVDKGSETGEMFAQQEALRTAFGDYDLEKYPSFRALQSKHNIMIEVCWKWFRKFSGVELRGVIEEGKTNGLFNSSYQMHCDLFHWLWPKIVQSVLDDYVKYWNGHRTRKQNDSPMPSGTTPTQVMQCPQDYGMADVGIDVTPEAIQLLRERLPARTEILRWVSDEFECVAQDAYDAIGQPSLEGSQAVARGWEIFAQMAEAIEVLMHGTT
ncbi:hypothetical protein E1B28_008148 [Marasmius oreades]|uniref:Integrase catalytic domain-containing protein n=1 Tax=Marasmius oreades TaxID=181124 RepID=A0A9P7RYG4_9AGAR|nr:uncharacterized protein E1B28_008148 [Marasmius oreades]KAG7091747.1 hypothetical protein E1B28_008148 [Marasmius oreades]